MFAPNRFVVVDDEPAHLKAIQDSLEALGSSCVAFRYDAANPGQIPVASFAAVRVVFMDLQLTTYLPMSDQNTHFSIIQSILEEAIAPTAGPYVMVLWTNQTKYADELESYLSANMAGEFQHAIPLAVLQMDKLPFLSDGGKGATVTDPAALRAEVEKKVGAIPGLSALLAWETEVISASDRVVGDVVDLARAERAAAPDLPTALRRLADEAVGSPNVVGDPQAAVHTALLPLLQDHVQYEMVGDGLAAPAGTTVWEQAFTTSPTPPDPRPAPLTRETAAVLNAKLHLGGKNSRLTPTTWGAVCESADTIDWPQEFGLKDGKAYLEAILSHVKVLAGGLKPDQQTARIVQIRVGAACDYAQKKAGPTPYAVGAFVPLIHYPAPAAPVVAEDTNDDGGDESSTSAVVQPAVSAQPANAGKRQKPPKPPKYPKDLGAIVLIESSTLWLSPMLSLPDWGAGHLVVNPRFVRNRGDDAANRFVVVDRLREQLLLQLIAAISHHSARPGIVRYEGSDSQPT